MLSLDRDLSRCREAASRRCPDECPEAVPTFNSLAPFADTVDLQPRPSTWTRSSLASWVAQSASAPPEGTCFGNLLRQSLVYFVGAVEKVLDLELKGPEGVQGAMAGLILRRAGNSKGLTGD
jgi:hypothetical protein